MSFKLHLRRFLLFCIAMFLLVLAWGVLAGGLRQVQNSITVGQQIETIVQLVCGLLSIMTVITCFRWRRWAEQIRLAWAISLVTTAGLSSLVWGPPMPFVAMGFAAVGLCVALATIWALQRLSADDISTGG